MFITQIITRFAFGSTVPCLVLQNQPHICVFCDWDSNPNPSGSQPSLQQRELNDIHAHIFIIYPSILPVVKVLDQILSMPFTCCRLNSKANIYIFWLGIKPRLQWWEHQILTTRPPGSPDGDRLWLKGHQLVTDMTWGTQVKVMRLNLNWPNRKRQRKVNWRRSAQFHTHVYAPKWEQSHLGVIMEPTIIPSEMYQLRMCTEVRSWKVVIDNFSSPPLFFLSLPSFGAKSIDLFQFSIILKWFAPNPAPCAFQLL